MKLLLDTHIWVWSVLEPSKLKNRIARAMVDPHNELWLSPISTWEIVMLNEKKRLRIEGNVTDWIEERLKSTPVHEAPVTHEVAMEVDRVRLPHRDPADRFLIATAKVFKLTLVTADDRLIKVRDVPILANR